MTAVVGGARPDRSRGRDAARTADVPRMVVREGMGSDVSLVRLCGCNNAESRQHDGKNDDPRQVRDEAQAQPLTGFSGPMLETYLRARVSVNLWPTRVNMV